MREAARVAAFFHRLRRRWSRTARSRQHERMEADRHCSVL